MQKFRETKSHTHALIYLFFCELVTKFHDTEVWKNKIFLSPNKYFVKSTFPLSTQFGQFRILLPIRFYMKSFLEPKNAILIILPALNFEILLIFDIFKFEIPVNLISKPPKVFKWQFLTFSKKPKLISRKI